MSAAKLTASPAGIVLTECQRESSCSRTNDMKASAQALAFTPCPASYFNNLVVVTKIGFAYRRLLPSDRVSPG